MLAAGRLPGRAERSEAEIQGAVALAQAGDMEAIRFLYVRFRATVQRAVERIVADPHESEDVTQQVFVKLIVAIHRYRAQRAPFAGWLVAVARNVALDHVRRRRPVSHEMPLGEPWRESQPDGREQRPGLEQALEQRLGLEQALGALSPDHRAVLVLRHLVGLSPVEIAQRLGRSESAIDGLHHRARRAIARELSDGA